MAVWKVKVYIEAEIEADSEEEAIDKAGDCILEDLDETGDLRDIAEVGAEKISDGELTDDTL